MATPPDTQEYYVKMAAKLKALADYARSDPGVNPKVAENLKSFAENILRDVTLAPPRASTALLA
jgi:hypothetical protein